MKYEAGSFIYHDEYGVGQVLSVAPGDPDEATINFQGRPQIILTTFLLDRSAHILSTAGFRALAYSEPEYAQLLIQEEPVEVIYLTLHDFPLYQAQTEDLKDYLAGSIPDWETWWEKTQPLLKTDPRIDTSQSKLRQYRIAREMVSQAEETYLAFRRLKHTINAPQELAERALTALNLTRKDSALTEDHREELLVYLDSLISSEQTAPGLRIETLFHMMEAKWLAPAEGSQRLERMLKEGLRLYQLNPYTQKRLVDELQRRPVQKKEVDLLVSGICANEATIKSVTTWAMRKSWPELIARMLETAFTDNLPPLLDESQYPSLRFRMQACNELARSLSTSDTMWPNILGAFRQIPLAMANLQKQDHARVLYPTLVKLAASLHQRAQSSAGEEDLVLEGLVGPQLTIIFIFEILKVSQKLEGAVGFHEALVDYLFANADRRQDQFLVPFICSFWSDPYDQAGELIKLVRRYPQDGMIEIGGRYFCELARMVEPDQLARWIPFLDEFHRREGEWSWQTILAGLRSRAYLAWLQEISDSISRRSYTDDALEEAAREWLKENRVYLLNQIAEEQAKGRELQEQLNDLQALLSEKEKILRELRSGFGGDTREARFEERSRLLKELVNTLAEFERLAVRQEILSQEFHAILRRLENLIQAQGVIAQEPIASQVAFNPQKHRNVGKEETNNGDMVIVEERGYLIRDNQGRLRILKPAFVKKG